MDAFEFVEANALARKESVSIDVIKLIIIKVGKKEANLVPGRVHWVGAMARISSVRQAILGSDAIGIFVLRSERWL